MTEQKHKHDGKRFRVIDESFHAMGWATPGEIYTFDLAAFQAVQAAATDDNCLPMFGIDFEHGEMCYYNPKAYVVGEDEFHWWYILPTSVEFIEDDE